MRVLFIGDIVGDAGCDFVCGRLSSIVKEYGIDFVIANGENVCAHNGITPDKAERLRYAGVDVITTGNHVFRQKQIYPLLSDSEYIIRPYNLPSSAVGSGYTVASTPFGDVGVLNLMGQCFMEGTENPFDAADRALARLSDCEYIFVDFHAEATSEKIALGHYLDGRVNGVFGTHTHVRTADARILPKGTAYITDAGMTGGENSVLGVKKELAIAKFRSSMPASFEHDPENTVMDIVVTDTDKKEILSLSIK